MLHRAMRKIPIENFRLKRAKASRSLCCADPTHKRADRTRDRSHHSYALRAAPRRHCAISRGGPGTSATAGRRRRRHLRPAPLPRALPGERRGADVPRGAHRGACRRRHARRRGAAGGRGPHGRAARVLALRAPAAAREHRREAAARGDGAAGRARLRRHRDVGRRRRVRGRPARAPGGADRSGRGGRDRGDALRVALGGRRGPRADDDLGRARRRGAPPAGRGPGPGHGAPGRGHREPLLRRTAPRRLRLPGRELRPVWKATSASGAVLH